MSDDKSQKQKSLDMALEQIQKITGKGTKLGDKLILKLASISTDQFLLMQHLDRRSPLRGRIIEIYGPESSGKRL